MNKIPPYHPELKEKARVNRKNMNNPEADLWYKVLSKRKLSGFRFNRQKPIDNYIVDFYCAKLKLVIEVDGESHNSQIEYDLKRTNKLEKMGLKVLRYTNYEVMQNLEGVYLDLVKQIKKRWKELY